MPTENLRSARRMPVGALTRSPPGEAGVWFVSSRGTVSKSCECGGGRAASWPRPGCGLCSSQFRPARTCFPDALGDSLPTGELLCWDEIEFDGMPPDRSHNSPVRLIL